MTLFEKFLRTLLRIANKLKMLHRADNFFGEEMTLRLNRASFSNLPPVPLPDGFELKTYDPSQYLEVSILYLKSDLGLCDLMHWRSNILDGGHKVVVNSATGKIVSSCFAAKSFKSSQVGRFEWLVVDKSYRGQGLGFALAYSVTSILAESEVEIVELNTYQRMKGAISIYESLGWEYEQ